MDKRKQDIAYFISFCIEQLTCTIQIKMPHLHSKSPASSGAGDCYSKKSITFAA